jgi:hypothetical protein
MYNQHNNPMRMTGTSGFTNPAFNPNYNPQQHFL